MEGLKDAGWDGAVIAALDGLTEEQVNQLVGKEAEHWSEEQRSEVMKEAKRRRMAIDREDTMVATRQKLQYLDRTWVKQRGYASFSPTLDQGRFELLKKALPRMTWATKLQKALAGTDNFGQRAKLENEERDRWIELLVRLLKDTELITDAEYKQVKDKGGWMLRKYGVGRRGNTIRSYVRVGRKLAFYMQNVYNEPWFRDEGEVIEYLVQRNGGALWKVGASNDLWGNRIHGAFSSAATGEETGGKTCIGKLLSGGSDIRSVELAEEDQCEEVASSDSNGLGVRSGHRGGTGLQEDLCVVQADQALGCTALG